MGLLPLTTNAQESGFTVSTTGGSGIVEGVAGYSAAELPIAKALNYGPADAALFAESRDELVANQYTPGCIYEDASDRRCNKLDKIAFKAARDQTLACSEYGACSNHCQSSGSRSKWIQGACCALIGDFTKRLLGGTGL